MQINDHSEKPIKWVIGCTYLDSKGDKYILHKIDGILLHFQKVRQIICVDDLLCNIKIVEKLN